MAKSLAEVLFPDAKSLFGVRLKSLSDLKSDSLIVLDTNVLLVPYTINPKGLDEIANTYKSLARSGRLFIPAQVAREFAKNRPTKLTELYQQLSAKRSKATKLQVGQYSLLSQFQGYNELLNLERVINEKIGTYQQELFKVMDHVRNWTWNDPVSLLYADIFNPDIIIEAEINEVDLREDLKRRQDYKLPPGYKDSAKEDGGVGDLLIWHTILQLGRISKKSVIFVSADGKPDWFHQSDGPLYPRFELIDEFRRNTNSASFHILKLSDFLDLFGAGGDLIEEVRIEEAKIYPVTEAHAIETAEVDDQAAVVHWIMDKYPTFRYPSSLEEGRNRVLIVAQGCTIEVLIKRIPIEVFRHRRIRDILARVDQEATNSTQDTWIFFIVKDRSEAEVLHADLGHLMRQAGAFRLTIGFINEFHIFVEYVTFRMDGKRPSKV